MVRYIYLFILSSLVLSSCFRSLESQADIDPRVKTISTLALYGTVGGALLGTATMAYGTSSRSIFKGASLGLYAGLIFGAYVVVSHKMKEDQQNASDVYPQEVGPGTYQDESGGEDYSDSLSQRWSPYFGQKEVSQNLRHHFPFVPFAGKDYPLIRFELYRYNF